MGGSADAGVMTRSCEAQSAPSATNALVIAIFASRRRDDGLDWAGAPGRELYRSALPSDRLCLYALRVSRQSLSTLSSDFSHQFRVVVSYLHENWACVCQQQLMNCFVELVELLWRLRARGGKRPLISKHGRGLDWFDIFFGIDTRG